MGFLYSYSYGQIYSAASLQETPISIVQISVDTSFSTNGIFVKKHIITQSDNNLYNSNTLILLGEFEATNNGVVLDYSRYNYYLLPFKPNEALLSLNYKNLNNTVGTLYIGETSMTQQRSVGNPGDFWYFCSCNGDHSNPDGPGGCVANMSDNIVTCVDDGRGRCVGACKGDGYVEPNYSINGGGIFVQVSKEKSILYHDFRTGSQ